MDKLDCSSYNPTLTEYDYCFCDSGGPGIITEDCERCPYSDKCDKKIIYNISVNSM